MQKRHRGWDERERTGRRKNGGRHGDRESAWLVLISPRRRSAGRHLVQLGSAAITTSPNLRSFREPPLIHADKELSREREKERKREREREKRGWGWLGRASPDKRGQYRTTGAT